MNIVAETKLHLSRRVVTAAIHQSVKQPINLPRKKAAHDSPPPHPPAPPSGWKPKLKSRGRPSALQTNWQREQHGYLLSGGKFCSLVPQLATSSPQKTSPSTPINCRENRACVVFCFFLSPADTISLHLIPLCSGNSAHAAPILPTMITTSPSNTSPLLSQPILCAFPFLPALPPSSQWKQISRLDRKSRQKSATNLISYTRFMSPVLSDPKPGRNKRGREMRNAASG